MSKSVKPMSGRRAQAARNDVRILEAARAVFVENPNAAVSAVAERAKVGIAALYRRYPSKEDLLRAVCGEGLRRYLVEAEKALADSGPVWEAFVGFMRGVVAEDTHSNTLRLAGAFRPTPELLEQARRSHALTVELVERAKEQRAIRPDLDVNDLSPLFEQLSAIRLGDERRTQELRERYLALLLDAIRAPSTSTLPGEAPRWEEVESRWQIT